MAAAALKKGRAKPNRRAGGRTAARQVVTPTVVPMLSYEDGVAAMEWLSRAFGFREIARHTGPDGYESPKRHREHCDPARKWSTVPWIIDGVLVLLAIVVAAAASGVGAQTPRIETLGSFPWDGSTGSVLLQRVADDRLVVQLRVVASSETSAGRVQYRTFQTDAVEAWVLLDDGSALEQLPRQPPKGAPPVGLSNAGTLSAFVSFGFKTPPGPEMVAVVVSVDGRHYVYALPAKSGAERAQPPSAEAVTPLITQPSLIRWPLSEGIQAVTLMDQQTFLKVDLAGQSVPEGRGATPVAPSPDGLQVWVLRKDGTVVSHRSPIREAGLVSMGGWATRSRELTFAYAPFRDLAGVIVRVNGKLLVRELPPPGR